MCWSCSGVLIFTLPRRPQLSQCQRTTLTISLEPTADLRLGLAIRFLVCIAAGRRVSLRALCRFIARHEWRVADKINLIPLQADIRSVLLLVCLDVCDETLDSPRLDFGGQHERSHPTFSPMPLVNLEDIPRVVLRHNTLTGDNAGSRLG